MPRAPLVLEGGGMVNLDHAAAQGQTRFNADFGQKHELLNLITGRKSEQESDEDDVPPSIGTFHSIPPKLKRSLIATAKKFAKRNNRQYHAALQRQQKYGAHMNKIAMEKR